LKKCPDFCENIRHNTTEIVHTEHKLYYIFNGSPYMAIEASVAALNLAGNGEFERATIQTMAKPKDYEKINITRNAKEIQVNIWPGCPYTGPFTYTIHLRKKEGNVSVNALVSEDTIVLNHTFGGLIPVTNYTVCVTAEKLKEKCSMVKTKIIASESAPLLTLKINASKLLINISKTDQMYADENEILTYIITTEIKCIQSSPECASTDCSSSYKSMYFNKPLESFEELLLSTTLNRKYRVQGSVKNSAGVGKISNWTDWKESLPATEEDFDNLKIYFLPTATENSITVSKPSICPYLGNPMTIDFVKTKNRMYT
jgi:hypothetical protein